MSRKYGERQRERRREGGREGERSGGEESMSSASADNPFCLDENYPALIRNYFPPSVSISNRMCNKLIYMKCIFSPGVYINIYIFFTKKLKLNDFISVGMH